MSSRFSLLSRLTGDSRLTLSDRANRVETVNGIHCLLWRTHIHPFRSSNPLLNWLMNAIYARYAEAPNATFDEVIAHASYIIVESSAAAIYIRRIRRLNPTAKVIYYAADRLDTVGAHPFIQRRLTEDDALIDHFMLRSAKLKHDFPSAKGRLYKAGFGIDPGAFDDVGPSPYPAGTTSAVSVGSMLFDPTPIQMAAPLFPDIEFYIIGSGMQFEAPANVHIHSEMPFAATLPFVKHATVGIAPYRFTAGADYLADSSLKLAQFEHLAIPAVCPSFAVGESPGRFGYDPGDTASIVSAFTAARANAGLLVARPFPAWVEIARQVVEPQEWGAPPIE